jgi:hypothetical protein
MKQKGLVADGQIFIVDYSNVFIDPDNTPLQRVSPINGNYLAAPIALFQYDPIAATLVPYGIQVETDAIRFPDATMVYLRDINNGSMWR